jgi:hypothetical protein
MLAHKNIRTSHDGIEHIATLDGYDGAPDATGPSSFIGTGGTEKVAIENLKDSLYDHFAEKLNGGGCFTDYTAICRGCHGRECLVELDGCERCGDCWIDNKVSEALGTYIVPDVPKSVLGDREIMEAL